jgi:hypothetical protein
VFLRDNDTRKDRQLLAELLTLRALFLASDKVIDISK